MTSDDITGMTLSELTLVLLFVVLLLFTIAFKASPIKNKDAILKQEKLIEELQHSISEYKNEIEKLEENINECKELLPKKDLRSKARPNCIEKGIIKDYLADITILGSNNFLVKGDKLTFDELKSEFKADLQEARANGCSHSIKIYYAEGVSLSEYQEADKKLSKTFYIKRMGVK